MEWERKPATVKWIYDILPSEWNTEIGGESVQRRRDTDIYRDIMGKLGGGGHNCAGGGGGYDDPGWFDGFGLSTVDGTISPFT